MKTITIDGIEYELKEIQKQKTKEERFAELISGIDISKPIVDFVEYPNTIFWFDQDGSCISEYDFENGFFLLNYYQIWSVFEEEFGLNYDEIQAFTQVEVEKHFKLKGVKTSVRKLRKRLGVEKHFKLKGVKTKVVHYPLNRTVEKHFKSKDVKTPTEGHQCPSVVEKHFKLKTNNNENCKP